MTLQEQIKALLDFYKGDKRMLAIKAKCSTRTIDRILADITYELQTIRRDRIAFLYNRNCNSK